MMALRLTFMDTGSVLVDFYFSYMKKIISIPVFYCLLMQLLCEGNLYEWKKISQIIADNF